ncbi:MAG: ferredoxin-thioredoxin reductase variable chain [Elainellaceae cyanobacterium]
MSLHNYTAAYQVEDKVESMKVGDRVRVRESVIVYHNPQNRNKPFDIQGFEGEVSAIASEWHGKVISANFPVQVKFDKRFKAHLREDELEVIEAS